MLTASKDTPATSSGWGPQRIVCLTEEPTEWLYLLGQERRIVGISGYTVRPPRAREEKPKVSAYLSAKIDKIVALQPDCVIGFSDLQADIAAQLIRAGIQVTIFNQRSVAEIFSMMYQLAAMVGQEARGLALMQTMQSRLLAIERAAATLKRRPRVYFEEWYEPHISAIAWVSELLGIAGGDDCFPELAAKAMGKDRIIADGGEIVRRNPDIIFGSWCGRKFRPAHVAARPGWQDVNAVKNGQLFEIKSAEILQPGPAALTDGVEQLHRIIMAWDENVATTLATSRAADESLPLRLKGQP
ncbi:ABC transporter substrate-binding protein [Polaromonas sp. UBA4122]|uniref:ABC transporter substrate-binding protein n=1 Tax=Polaromonas sp. UBA4122 TaxID=1947074 RepID=UPI0025F1DFC1|nr:ABC transporter substrate-binding protein [Polaromonas sp. UBA4122]